MTFNEIIDEITANVIFYQDRDNHEIFYAEFTDGNGVSHFTRISSDRFLAFLRLQYAVVEKQDRALDTKRAIRYIRDNFLYFDPPPQVEAFIRKAGNLTTGIEYDLHLPDGKIVEVDCDGWRIKEKSKHKFLRPAEALPQQIPKKTSDDLLTLLKPFVNLQGDDLILLALWLVQSFCNGLHSALLIMAERGSGKSTLSRVIRRILDPSRLDITPFPSKNDDLLVLLGNTQLVCFDNVGEINKDQSDILCSAITSATTAKRALYTDSGLTLQKLRNTVVLNGISVLPKESDLAERFIMINLKKITGRTMKSEREFWAEFDGKLPYILGAIFNVLSIAMNYTYENDGYLPRMSDAYADMKIIAHAMKISEAEFDRIYSANSEKLHRARAETPLVEALREYMNGPWAGKRSFEGTASEVYRAIKDNYSGNRVLLPGSVAHFSRKLDSEHDSLKAVGFRVNINDTESDCTRISIIRRK